MVLRVASLMAALVASTLPALANPRPEATPAPRPYSGNYWTGEIYGGTFRAMRSTLSEGRILGSENRDIGLSKPVLVLRFLAAGATAPIDVAVSYSLFLNGIGLLCPESEHDSDVCSTRLDVQPPFDDKKQYVLVLWSVPVPNTTRHILVTNWIQAK